MAASQEVIDLLRSIDASLKSLVQQTRATAPKPIADDRELDSQYGDPIVKFMPRDWTGPVYTGRRMSECPAALLDMLADAFDYFGDIAEQKDERTSSGKPVAIYKRKDAARARGWAKRVREGRVPVAAGASAETDFGPSEWPDEEL